MEQNLNTEVLSEEVEANEAETAIEVLPEEQYYVEPVEQETEETEEKKSFELNSGAKAGIAAVAVVGTVVAWEKAVKPGFSKAKKFASEKWQEHKANKAAKKAEKEAKKAAKANAKTEAVKSEQNVTTEKK